MEKFHRLKFSIFNIERQGTRPFDIPCRKSETTQNFISTLLLDIPYQYGTYSFIPPPLPIANQKFARDNKILSPPCSQFPLWWTRAIFLSFLSFLSFFLTGSWLTEGGKGRTHRIGRTCLKGMEGSGRLKKKKKEGVSMQIREYILVDRWFVVSVVAGRPVISRGCIRRGIDRPMRHHMPLHNGKQITKLPY